MASAKLKLLFLCTHNACRSQMAEAWARHLKRDVIDAHSAGVEPSGMDPLTVRVMNEAGVDISDQRSKSVEELRDVEFDYVVTLCGHAREVCPLFPGKTKKRHVGFDSPQELAQSARDEKAALAHYRRVRDEIRDFVARLPDALVDK
jgi:arsenate reductase